LPYVANSVDVVVIPASDAGRMAEADRIGLAAVVILPDAAQGSDSRLTIHWKTRSAAGLPTVSLIVPLESVAAETDLFVRSLRDTLAPDFVGEIVVATAADPMSEGLRDWVTSDMRVRLAHLPRQTPFHTLCNSAVAAAAGEIVVFLDPTALLLPDWLPPLLRVFRDRPNAGAAGGKILAPDGQVSHAGGMIAPGGAVENLLPSDVVRAVDWCSSALLATRRELFAALGGFDGDDSPASYVAADYCLRVREHGYGVFHQPDAAAVLLHGAPAETDVAAPPAFVERWLA